MDQRSLRVLEWDKIKQQLAEHASFLWENSGLWPFSHPMTMRKWNPAKL